jgi:hypothetical protein
LNKNLKGNLQACNKDAFDIQEHEYGHRSNNQWKQHAKNESEQPTPR